MNYSQILPEKELSVPFVSVLTNAIIEEGIVENGRLKVIRNKEESQFKEQTVKRIFFLNKSDCQTEF